MRKFHLQLEVVSMIVLYCPTCIGFIWCVVLDKPFYIVVYAVYFVHEHFYILSAVNFCIYNLHNLILFFKRLWLCYILLSSTFYCCRERSEWLYIYPHSFSTWYLITSVRIYINFTNTSSVGNFSEQTPSKHRANSKMPTFATINQKLFEI